MCENKIEDNNEKICPHICRRFSITVSRKIDFTVFGLHRDHPPTLELTIIDQSMGGIFA